MNFLDKAISFVAPTWGLQRARARVALRYAERFSYEGAKSGRRTDGWIAGSTDANVEIRANLNLLRDRSRELIRNNPHANKAIDELVGNSVGTGIMPRAKTGDVNLDKKIDSEWAYFAEQCDSGSQLDFYGMQALIVRATAESGEGLARFRTRLKSDGLRVPLQIQILESDYIDSNRGNLSPSDLPKGGFVIAGIQFDPIGRRTAYWLFKNHPGSNAITTPGGFVSVPIPAEDVMHTYRIQRPGQVRGVPWLAPVMTALRDLDDYADAERIRKKIEACMVGIVTQPDGMGGSPIGSSSQTTDPQTGNKLDYFEPGMYKYAKPGESVTFNNPQVIGGYGEFKSIELQSIGAGVGVPYEMLTGDLSKVNYSSYRAGMLGFRNTVEAFRWLTLIPAFCQPTWRRFIDILVLQGKLKQAAYGCQWTAPKWESVDPW
jgi:lambda family phage portal protein